MTYNIKKILKKTRLLTGKQGFTLLETLVAVTILATAIAGPLSIASRSLTNSLITKNQTTAFFLAQDSVEYIRFIRDSNSLKGANWITGSGGSSAGVDLSPCVSANGCYIDSTSNNPAAPTECSTPACSVMNYDTPNVRYTYATGAGITPSIFTRQIRLTSISADEYNLSVTVSWVDSGAVTRSISVNENIFQWQ